MKINFRLFMVLSLEGGGLKKYTSTERFNKHVKLFIFYEY